MDIENLQSGPELDVLIAIKVMGFELVSGTERRITAGRDVNYWVRPEHSKLKNGAFHKKYIVCREDLLDKYSTTWEGAGQVIEKMRPLKLDIEDGEAVFYKEWAYGSYRIIGSDREIWPFSGDTYPHAICIAALEAKELI